MVDIGPPPKEEPWLLEPATSTLRWVNSHDGREIPLRYTEMRPDVDKLQYLIEVWPNYPAVEGKLTFRFADGQRVDYP